MLKYVVQEAEMETLRATIWSQLSLEQQKRVIAILVQMLLDYLAQEKEQCDEPA